MAEGDAIIGAVSVAITPDASDFWRRFEAQTSAGAAEAGRNAGQQWRRSFDTTTADTNIRIGSDTRAVDTRLAELRAQLARGANFNINANVTGMSAGQTASLLGATNSLKDAQDRLRDARAELDAVTQREGHSEDELRRASEAVARAQRAEELQSIRLAAAQESVAAAQKRAADQAQKDTAAQIKAAAAAKKNNQEQQSLLGILLPLAPAIAPIAGAATAAGAAFATMGVQALLAVKGASAAMKAGTAVGMQYAAGVASIKGSINQLEATAARGVLTGFNQAVAKAQAAVPGLNADLQQSTKVLGSIGSSAAGVAIGLVQDLNPAVSTVEKGIASLAKQGQAWANGPGGQSFGRTVAADFQQVEPVLQNLITDVGHLASAANGPGLGIVSLLNEITGSLKVLTSGPIGHGAFEALITGLSALKIASVVSGYFDRLKVSVGGTTIAELEQARAAERAAIAQGDMAAATRAAAAAQARAAEVSRVRSWGSTAVGVLGKVSAGWIAASIAADTAANATNSWLGDTSKWKRGVAAAADVVKNLLSFHWTDAFSGVLAGNKVAAYTGTIEKALTFESAHIHDTMQLWIKDGQSYYKQLQGPVLTLGMQQAAAYATDMARLRTAFAQTKAGLASLGASGGSASQLSQAYTQTADSLQKNISATQKFLTLGGQTVTAYHGVTIGAKTWAAALAQSNGDIAKARALVQSSVDGLRLQQNQLKLTTAARARLNKFVSDATIITGKLNGSQNQTTTSTSASAKQYQLTTQQVDLYSQALGINFDKLATSAKYERAAEQELRRFEGALVNAGPALTGWVNAVATFNQSNKTAADRAQLIGAALVSFNGDALSFQSTINQTAVASKQFASDLKQVHAGVVNVQKGTIDFHKAGAAPLLSDLTQMQTAGQNAAAAIYQTKVATDGSKVAAADAAKVYRNDTYGALVQQATQLGLTGTAAHNLAKEYFGMPKDVVTRIRQLGANTTNNLLRAIGNQLSILTKTPFTITINTDEAANRVRTITGLLRNLHGEELQVGINNVEHALRIPGAAKGTSSVPEGVSAVGEQGRELLVKHGNNVAVVPNGPTENFLRRTGAKIRGFAGGTQGSLLALARQYWSGKDAEIAAAVAMAESGGNANAHNYNPSTGDDSYGLWQDNIFGSLRSRLQTYHVGNPSNLYNPQTNARVAHAIWAGGGWGNWTTYRNGDYLQFMGAAGAISHGGHGASSAPTAAQRRAARKQRIQSARQAASTDAQGINTFRHSLGSVSGVNQALRPELRDLRKMGLSDHDLAQLNKERRELDADIKTKIADANALNAARQKLHAETQKFNQEIKTVASATKAGFDITQAGANAQGRVSFGSIRAQETQELNIIKKWAAGIKKLGHEGFNKSNAGKAMLRQLAEAGPSTWPQVDALLHATPKELAGIISTEQAIDQTANSLGHYEAKHLFGHQVAQDQRTVRQDKRQLRRARREVKRDAKELETGMVKALNSVFKHGIEIRIDPRGQARLVAKGDHLRNPAHPRSHIARNGHH